MNKLIIIWLALLTVVGCKMYLHFDHVTTLNNNLCFDIINQTDDNMKYHEQRIMDLESFTGLGVIQYESWKKENGYD